MLRRLAALASALMVTFATLAPGIASATAPIAGLCACVTHDHCPMQTGKHTCAMPGGAAADDADAPAFSHCDPATLFAVVPALAPFLPAEVDAPTMAAQPDTLPFPSAFAVIERASAPDVPPPRG